MNERVKILNYKSEDKIRLFKFKDKKELKINKSDRYITKKDLGLSAIQGILFIISLIILFFDGEVSFLTVLGLFLLLIASFIGIFVLEEFKDNKGGK